MELAFDRYFVLSKVIQLEEVSRFIRISPCLLFTQSIGRTWQSISLPFQLNQSWSFYEDRMDRQEPEKQNSKFIRNFQLMGNSHLIFHFSFRTRTLFNQRTTSSKLFLLSFSMTAQWDSRLENAINPASGAERYDDGTVINYECDVVGK